MIIRNMLFASTVINRLPMVYEPGKAGWKLNADGTSIAMKDGNPIWVNDKGEESVLQQDTIARLNNEAAGHRTRAEKAEKDLAKFKDIDPDKAKSAIELVGKLDQKKLIDAGEVDKVRAEIKTEYEGKLAEQQKTLGEVTSDLHGLRINNIFDGSEFVRDQVAIPRDMFTAYFKSNFKIGADGKTVEAYGKDGNRVFSKVKSGEYADPAEALEILVNQHPQKDVILKPSNQSGSGNNGNSGHRPGQRVMKRAEYDQISISNPAQAAALAKQMGSGELIIND